MQCILNRTEFIQKLAVLSVSKCRRLSGCQYPRNSSLQQQESWFQALSMLHDNERTTSSPYPTLHHEVVVVLVRGDVITSESPRATQVLWRAQGTRDEWRGWPHHCTSPRRCSTCVWHSLAWSTASGCSSGGSRPGPCSSPRSFARRRSR